MNWLLQDIRHGLRSLARSPGFTVIAVLTLAIGISANTSIFSVIEAVILRPLPYKDPARLVLLADSRNPQDGGFLLKDFESVKSENRTLEDVAEYYRDSGFSRVTIAGAGEPQSVQGAYVTANFFPLMGSFADSRPCVQSRGRASPGPRHRAESRVVDEQVWRFPRCSRTDIADRRPRFSGNRGDAENVPVSSPRPAIMGTAHDESILGRPLHSLAAQV